MHSLIEPVLPYLATLLKRGRGLMCYHESNIDCLKQCASDLDKFDIISHIEYLLVSIKDSIFEKPLLDNELGLKYNAVANHGQNIPSYLICKRNLSNFQTVASKLRNAITMSIVKKKNVSNISFILSRVPKIAYDYSFLFVCLSFDNLLHLLKVTNNFFAPAVPYYSVKYM